MARQSIEEPKKPTAASVKKVCPICGFYDRDGDYFCPICEVVMSCHLLTEQPAFQK